MCSKLSLTLTYFVVPKQPLNHSTTMIRRANLIPGPNKGQLVCALAQEYMVTYKCSVKQGTHCGLSDPDGK